MHDLAFRQMIDAAGTMIPLAILLIEDDAQRQFLTEIYLEYKALMYKTAIDFFGKGSGEAEDAVSASVERMCRYSHTRQAVACNKRAAYIVLLVENACRDRLRQIVRRRGLYNDGLTDEELEQMPDGEDPYATVFDRSDAAELLASFQGLTERERELIWMRHVDLMEYHEMAAALHMKEGAVRTALSRAKKRLEALAGAAWEVESDIQALEYQLAQGLASRDSWTVFEPTLKAYQHSVAPYLDLGLNPYVESSAHSTVYEQLMAHVRQYLNGGMALDECVQKLNGIVSFIYWENANEM